MAVRLRACCAGTTLLLAVTAPPAQAGPASFYLDPVHGSPANPGTSAEPWRTLEEVLASGRAFAAGDILYLRTGNHGNPVVHGGVATGSRTIRAQAGHTPRLRGLRFQPGATGWTVSGVLVSPAEAGGALGTGTLVQFDSGATGNTLRDSQLRAAPDAVAAEWGNNDWVDRSGTAVLVAGARNLVLDNRIRNVRNGVMVERTSKAGAGGTGTVVRGNRVEHFWEDAFRCKVSGCVVEYNRAVNSYAVVPPGMEDDPPHRDMFQSYRGDGSFTEIADVVLRGNVFLSRQGARYTRIPFQYNGKYTTQGIGCFDGPYRNWTVENNVVLVEVGLALALYGIDDSRIVNNTVVPGPLGNASELRIMPEKGGNPAERNVIRNNLVHKLNIGAAVNTRQSNNITVGTAYDSYFVDHATHDVRLKPGSPAIDAGTPLDAPTIDAGRQSRTLPYDVGAYEF
ncbi:choice-of-anchor Q domain-containing protein [Crossiella sp. CA198]|uniref:choice-of-anchor Q domain-containing protein n=1 Tax=Crossiella sp. CA198 TaxID=3455607 RepID=UPI003F8D80D6